MLHTVGLVGEEKKQLRTLSEQQEGNNGNSRQCKCDHVQSVQVGGNHVKEINILLDITAATCCNIYAYIGAQRRSISLPHDQKASHGGELQPTHVLILTPVPPGTLPCSAFFFFIFFLSCSHSEIKFFVPRPSALASQARRGIKSAIFLRRWCRSKSF